MPWCAVLRFADPEVCAAAVQGADVAVFPTAGGCFDTEITKVRFDRLWMQRFHSALPQVATVVHKPDRKAISFLTAPQSPTLTCCGLEVLPGDVIVSRGGVIHKRFGREVRYGAMSLPTNEWNTAFKAITGRELAETQQGSIVRPDAALMSRLLRFHNAVGQLAHESPDILELPEVGRALEERLIHIMVRCLSESTARPITTGRQRHDAIMARFEEFLAAHPDRPLYLTEICAGIGVAERTLRASCEEHLGMGPIRYLTLRRLHLVRSALRAAEANETSVTRIVTDHGFWELGRFSVAYRTLFGESPSETLRQPAQRRMVRLDRPSSLPIDASAARLN